MKKFRLILLIALLASGVSVYAWKPAPGRHHRPPRRRCVAVPLDGGILAILGAAGVTYFLVRRKSNKKEK